MDLLKLSRMLNSTAAAGNASQPLNFAPTILEAFIPGYSLMSRFVSHAIGFDAGVLVSVVALLFALGTAWKYFSKTFSSILDDYLVATIYFDECDDLFPSVLAWISDQRVGKLARRLKAISTKQGGSPEEDEVTQPADMERTELFHFGKWAARVPPTFQPYFGNYAFVWNWRIFFFERGRKEKTATPWQSRSEEENITLKTLGWSTAPVKDLLRHVKQWSLERENSVTVIKRPQSKESRRSQGQWARVTARPSRPMETVVLDPEQKQALVEDVNEYLSPASPKWYAVRGIPYRRGYLFHGPPGTGKSSLSFALAGLFGLNVHVISLLEPTLTETDLALLFNNLPKRCIVLLEDIDTAGLARTDNDAEPDTKLTNGTKDYATTAADLLKEVKKAGRRGGGRVVGGTMMDGESKSGISLSGLLNAIDGVASHEGRVLVMTTNHPEKLDPALLRPGRVDMQIAFTLATKHQVREIFSKMYHSSDQPANSASAMQEKRPPTNGCPPANGNTKGSNDFTTAPSSSANHHYSEDDIKILAEEFAEMIPEDKFSPAEVQSFLITRKKYPQRAMAEVEKWRDELLEVKVK
ncbi:P-loop containing nucleoside triphosphate hydrolase protein [Venturia nashicola]|nr:P-loop containing nucleoside triphosphate hydrolase protein [Venturia nashicola]